MALRPVALHVEAGGDLRQNLEALAVREGATGFVLSVVGNLEQACFACPGQSAPTVLSGELEIITLQGTVSPQGVHLHLSLSDGECQVWGGHLEHGSRVLKGADVLVGLLEPMGMKSVAPTASGAPRVTVAVVEGCPWSARALRMLRTLAIPYTLVAPQPGASVPQIHLDGELIGGYDALADLHGRGELDSLRHG